MPTTFTRKILVLGTNETKWQGVVQWLITAMKADHFVWPCHELIIVITELKGTDLLKPLREQKGPNCIFVVIAHHFLISSQAFSTWA